MSQTAAVLGASGYGGAELLRLLATHPEVEVKVATAETQADQSVGALYPHLCAYADLMLKRIEAAARTKGSRLPRPALEDSCRVIFICRPTPCSWVLLDIRGFLSQTRSQMPNGPAAGSRGAGLQGMNRSRSKFSAVQ